MRTSNVAWLAAKLLFAFPRLRNAFLCRIQWWREAQTHGRGISNFDAQSWSLISEQAGLCGNASFDEHKLVNLLVQELIRRNVKAKIKISEQITGLPRA